MDKQIDKKKKILSDAVKGVMMQDAGVKMEKHDMPVATSSTSNKMRYPNLYLDSKECPQLKDYEFGDNVMMVVEGEITGHSKNQSLNSDRESFDIKIKKIGVSKKNK